MYISKSRFINWTRCPMYFAMELKFNASAQEDIDAESERRAEILGEMAEAARSEERGENNDDEEEFSAAPSPELEALLPYYNKVEDEALIVAQRYFEGSFVADARDVHNQQLFEYVHNDHTYRCYVDIYNENDKEINVIEVKATTSTKYTMYQDKHGDTKGLYFFEKKGSTKMPLFVKDGNIWRLNHKDRAISAKAAANFDKKKESLLNRFNEVGKYPHDIAFQKFVIENVLRERGDHRKVNYYLAVLNSEYVFNGDVDAAGNCLYSKLNDQEIITFFDMNEIALDYQSTIQKEIATLENNIKDLHDINKTVEVGDWCAWHENTECVYLRHCFHVLRKVDEKNPANKYLDSGNKNWDEKHKGKYALVNDGFYSMANIDETWLESENHKIQRACLDNKIPEHVDKEKMQTWFKKLEYPIYHFDFESFPCPLPRFEGEKPYRQSVFEFSLHIEREEGVCDKVKDNVIFLNKTCNKDERKALAKAIIDNFKFNEDGTLCGTMLAQNTSFEINRLKELASLYPEYSQKLLAITKKTADLIHLLKTDGKLYAGMFPEERAKTVNYYHKDLCGSYSIKKTLPVLVPSLSYDGMDVGNGVQAYIAYLNYDETTPTFGVLTTKQARRDALERYCQQDTWAMVEILRAVRKKL